MKRVLAGICILVFTAVAFAQPGSRNEDMDYQRVHKSGAKTMAKAKDGKRGVMRGERKDNKIDDEKRLEFIAKFDKNLAEELKKLKKEDSRMYRRVFAVHRRQAMAVMHDSPHFGMDKNTSRRPPENPEEMDKFAEKHKDMFEKGIKHLRLELDIQKLLKKYRTDNKANKTSLKKQITAKVDAEFDLKLEGERDRINIAKERLQNLEKKLEKRQKQKKSIVEDRVEDILGEKERW